MSASPSVGHWNFKDFRERVSESDWKQMCLNGKDLIFVAGHNRRLIGKRICPGVYEIYKAPVEAGWYGEFH